MRAAVDGAKGDDGFTLVELLVSLLLFALISLAGVGLIQTMVGVQERTDNRTDRLTTIQRAFVLITADVEQVSQGPFIDDGVLAFTRGSRSGDYPVIYRFAGATLYRETGGGEFPVLEGVQGMALRYWKNDAWTATPFTERDLARPDAVEIVIALAGARGFAGGTVRRVIELPDER